MKKLATLFATLVAVTGFLMNAPAQAAAVGLIARLVAADAGVVPVGDQH